MPICANQIEIFNDFILSHFIHMPLKHIICNTLTYICTSTFFAVAQVHGTFLMKLV